MSTILYEIEVRCCGRSLLVVDCRCLDDEHAIRYAPKRVAKLIRQYREHGDDISNWGDIANEWTVKQAYGYFNPILARGPLEAAA